MELRGGWRRDRRGGRVARGARRGWRVIVRMLEAFGERYATRCAWWGRGSLPSWSRSRRLRRERGWRFARDRGGGVFSFLELQLRRRGGRLSGCGFHGGELQEMRPVAFERQPVGGSVSPEQHHVVAARPPDLPSQLPRRHRTLGDAVDLQMIAGRRRLHAHCYLPAHGGARGKGRAAGGILIELFRSLVLATAGH